MRLEKICSWKRYAVKRYAVGKRYEVGKDMQLELGKDMRLERKTDM